MFKDHFQLSNFDKADDNLVLEYFFIRNTFSTFMKISYQKAKENKKLNRHTDTFTHTQVDRTLIWFIFTFTKSFDTCACGLLWCEPRYSRCLGYTMYYYSTELWLLIINTSLTHRFNAKTIESLCVEMNTFFSSTLMKMPQDF